MPNESSEHTASLQELQQRVRDLTESLKMAHQHISEAEKLALLGQLVAGIAHEINTPLGALKSNHDLFIRYFEKINTIIFTEGAAEAPAANEHLVKLFANIDKLNRINKTATDRIVEIVNSVRRYARQDESEPLVIDLHENLDSTITLVHHELKSRITLHKDYNPIPPISCYPNQLSQVFLNLLVNASQAIENHGDIYIKTYKQNHNIVVEIRDNGKGIAPAQLETIFEAGFTTKPTGMGMGLAIVKQIIEAHNGSIEVESAENRGTTFRISLPTDF